MHARARDAADGAGVMVFGNKHLAYNISRATIARNLFVRNGAGDAPDRELGAEND